MRAKLAAFVWVAFWVLILTEVLLPWINGS
jgi:hypothetical protein